MRWNLFYYENAKGDICLQQTFGGGIRVVKEYVNRHFRTATIRIDSIDTVTWTMGNDRLIALPWRT